MFISVQGWKCPFLKIDSSADTKFLQKYLLLETKHFLRDDQDKFEKSLREIQQKMQKKYQKLEWIRTWEFFSP